MGACSLAREMRLRAIRSEQLFDLMSALGRKRTLAT